MTTATRRTLAASAIVLAGMLGQAAGPLAPEAVAAPTAIPAQTYGVSYGEWGARWWQWLLSIPAATNPNLDPTGGNCAQGQFDNVWFLAGSFGSDVIRSCTIPAGKAVFFPIINTVIFKPKGYETLLDLRASADAFIDSVNTLYCTVDGVPCAQNLLAFRATTPSFTVMPPRKGLLPPGALMMPGNTDPLVADGYWMLLDGLVPGNTYTLRFGATTTGGFGVNVTYHLTVQ